MNTIRHHFRKLTMHDEVELFAPKTWAFWRNLIICFCVFTIVGHWLELLYCYIMDFAFGIIEDNYAIWFDPLFHPYWVYGIGAVVMTLVIEPLKEGIIRRRKTLSGAVLETFVLMVLLSMVMELGIGLLVNQPDQFGEYPYWDNSRLPLNVFGQAWLVNDVFIGLAAVFYVWLLYPLICRAMASLSERAANIALAVVLAAFALCVTVSYCQLISAGYLG